MSRKSKRRRMQQQTALQTVTAETGEAFEFLDDRAAPGSGGRGFAAAVADGEPRPRVQPLRVLSSPIGPGAPARARSETTARGIAPWQAAPARVTQPEPAPPALQPASPAPDPGSAAPATEPEPIVRTLGEILTSAREARGLSIEAAGARTRISAKMLLHLENDRFGEFAAEAYVRGSLRSYGSFLGLDVAMLVGCYETLRGRAAEPTPPPGPEPEVESVPRPAPHARPSRRAWLVTTALALVVVGSGAGIYLAHRGVLRLRPAAGLEQIENELRQAQAPDQAARPAPTEEPAAASAADPATESPPAVATAPGGEDTSPRRPDPEGDAILPVFAAPAPEPTARAARPAPITDLVEEPVPVARGAPATAAEDALVLTATARDSCTLRLQIDGDAGHPQRYRFTQRGETRSWSARRSFQLSARQARKLELWLNGRRVAVPADARSVVLDRRAVQAGSESDAAARRGASHSARRPRPSKPRPQPAPTRSTAHPVPQNAAGPPR